jgi:hypothetical protein
MEHLVVVARHLGGARPANVSKPWTTMRSGQAGVFVASNVFVYE